MTPKKVYYLRPDFSICECEVLWDQDKDVYLLRSGGGIMLYNIAATYGSYEAVASRAMKDIAAKINDLTAAMRAISETIALRTAQAAQAVASAEKK